MEPDRDLERVFRQVRAVDEQRTPSFSSLLAPRRASSKPSMALWLVPAMALIALVAIGVWRLSTPNAPAIVIAFTPGDMRVPTDYLLDVAAYPRAGEIPRIGTSDWFPMPVATDAPDETRRLP